MEAFPTSIPATPSTPKTSTPWEAKPGIRVRSGDVVFIRTGRFARRAERGPWSMAERAGLHASTAVWFRNRDIAILGSDASSDVRPSQIEGVSQPIHTLIIVAMGTPIFDNCYLEQLSREAKKRKRYEFLLTTSPLTVPGATGSPLNPIGIF